MATFKIRDLMVALRPGLQTPQRPAPLEECDPDTTIQCNVVPFDSGGCGDSCDFSDTGGCGCTDTCGDSCGGTCVCTGTCGLTDCTQCTNATCGCSCTATCRNASCGFLTCACTARTHFTNCPNSIVPQTVAQLPPTELARLKAQLQQAMQQVSKREAVLAAAAEKRAIVPQTLAQVDALQQKLSEAMDELRARRAEIQKATTPADPKATDDKK